MCTLRLGAGEPQYQLVPAIYEVMVRRLQQMAKNGQAKSDREIIIKSDGMGKQKHLGLRVLRLIAQTEPALVSNLRSDLWTATSTFEMRVKNNNQRFKRDSYVRFIICVVVCCHFL